MIFTPQFFIGYFLFSLSGIVLLFFRKSYIISKNSKIQKELERQSRLELLAEEAKAEERMASSRNYQEKEEGEIDYATIGKLLKRVYMLFSQKIYPEAEKILVQILSLKDDHIEANEQLALLYLQTKSYKKSENIYRKLSELSPKDPAVFTNLGLVLFHQNHFKEAVSAYEYALSLDPKHPTRHANIGQVYFVLRDFDQAVQHFKIAIKRAPKSVEFIFMLADTYREMGEYGQAKRMYVSVLDIEPYNAEARDEVERLGSMGY